MPAKNPTQIDPKARPKVCGGCNRLWKDILETPESDVNTFKDSRGIEYLFHTIGRGSTRRVCFGPATVSDVVKEIESKLIVPDDDDLLRGSLPFISFEDSVAKVESHTKELLEGAGLLSIEGEDYTDPKTWERVLRIIEERGLLPSIDEEWYAVKIL